MGRRAALRHSRGVSAWRLLPLAITAALLFVGSGCGSGDSAETRGSVEMHAMREARHQRAQRHAAMRRAHLHAQREAARRHARQARHERERRVREYRAQAAEERAQAEAAVEEEAESSCDPNYSGACLDPAASDYDCAGGSGNGPYYTGTVTVVGEDHYGLDADGDGTGCEIG